MLTGILIILLLLLWSLRGWKGRSPDSEDEIDAWIEFCDCMEDDE